LGTCVASKVKRELQQQPFHLALSLSPKVWLWSSTIEANGLRYKMQLCPNKNMYKKKDITLFFVIKFTHIATSILQKFSKFKIINFGTLGALPNIIHKGMYYFYFYFILFLILIILLLFCVHECI
jgi:hypothetical protein